MPFVRIWANSLPQSVSIIASCVNFLAFRSKTVRIFRWMFFLFSFSFFRSFFFFQRLSKSIISIDLARRAHIWSTLCPFPNKSTKKVERRCVIHVRNTQNKNIQLPLCRHGAWYTWYVPDWSYDSPVRSPRYWFAKAKNYLINLSHFCCCFFLRSISLCSRRTNVRQTHITDLKLFSVSKN